MLTLVFYSGSKRKVDCGTFLGRFEFFFKTLHLQSVRVLSNSMLLKLQREQYSEMVSSFQIEHRAVRSASCSFAFLLAADSPRADPDST